VPQLRVVERALRGAFISVRRSARFTWCSFSVNEALQTEFIKRFLFQAS
jgi:hypothetical protein